MMIKKAQEKIDDYYQNHPDGIAIDKESDEWLELNINPTEEEYAEFEAKMKAKYPSVNSISQYTEIIKQQLFELLTLPKTPYIRLLVM